ncbi:MAG: hypothetical protein VXZ72_03355, partial [Chlamydiota bacterium]|nr:hypothetical protein [Chlamydiota bacterium]
MIKCQRLGDHLFLTDDEGESCSLPYSLYGIIKKKLISLSSIKDWRQKKEQYEEEATRQFIVNRLNRRGYFSEEIRNLLINIGVTPTLIDQLITQYRALHILD